MFDIRNSVQHFVHILGILSGKDNKTSRYDKYPRKPHPEKPVYGFFYTDKIGKTSIKPTFLQKPLIFALTPELLIETY